MTLNGDRSPDTEPGSPLGVHDPRQIGPYLLLRRLGGGGMGTVYLARREDSTWRVALKVIQSGLLEHEPQLRDRFARELAHAQRVDARYTARILDADLHADLPWMATEYVPGPTLETKVARSGALALPALMDLACGVSEALAAIHAAGLVHRDLKPANVILAADGPRVIDFGIAHGAETTRLTGTGTTIGTLAYMSPEQLGGQPAGPGGDVFSMGGVLCYAATGHSPFPSGHYGAVIHAVLNSGPDLADLSDPWTRDLVAACLAKDHGRRPSPDHVRRACAARLQELVPVPAQAATVPVAAASPTAVAGPPPGAGRPVTPPAGPLPERSPSRRAEPRPRGGGRRLVLALAAVVPVLLVLVSLALYFLVFAGPALSDHVLVGHAGDVNDVAWSAKGDAVATASADSTVRIWDPVTGYTMSTLVFDGGTVYAVAFSPDGGTVATGDSGNTVRIWDAVTGKSLRTMSGHSSSVNAVAFSPDGRTVATASADSTVRIWDVATGKSLRTLTGHTGSVYAVAFSPDGRTVASGGGDNTVRIWDVATGAGVRALADHRKSVTGLAFSPDGKALATCSQDRTALIRVL